MLRTSKVENFSCWLQPEKDMFKFNIDGALFTDFQVASVGAILRDFQGYVLLATSIKELGIQDLETIEMLAVLRG